MNRDDDKVKWMQRNEKRMNCTSKSDERLLDYELGSNLDITH